MAENARPRLTIVPPAPDADGAPLHCTLVPGPAGDVAVLRVVGDVDALTVPLLNGALARALGPGSHHGIGHLVVDLMGVEFLSVSGMRTLVTADRSALRLGIGFSVAGLSMIQRRLVDLIWPVAFPYDFPTVQDAVAAR